MAPRKGKGGRRQRGTGGPSRGVGGGSSGVLALNPAPLNSQPSHKRTLRFVGNPSTSTSVAVTRGCLLSLLVATSGTSSSATNVFAPVYGGVRLCGVKVHIPGSVGTSGTFIQGISLEWLSDVGKPVKVSRTVISSIGAIFLSRPPPRSRSGMWSRFGSQTATTEEVLFVLDYEDSGPGASNVVLDVELECVPVQDDASYLTQTFTGNVTVPPGIYCAPLDNLLTSDLKATGAFLPIGIPNAWTAGGGVTTQWVRTDA